MNLTQIIPQLKEIIEKHEKFVILTHHNPDGDAIGSSLALYHMLKKIGKKEVEVIVPNDFPLFLKWLPEANKIWNAEFKSIQAKDFIHHADVIFCLDFNTSSRIEKLEKLLLESSATKVLIDHHQEPDAFDWMYSDVSQPATCQMIFKVFEELNILEKIDKDIATCIYTGMITDTGNFKYRNTTSETHRIAAFLLDQGIEIDVINSHVFDSNSKARLHLLGLVLSRIEVFPEYSFSYLYITRKELQECGFQKGDTEGFVNYGFSIQGIKLTVFLSEDLQKDIVKMSFRSVGNIDVNRLSRTYFNGGGHLNASGGRSEVSIEDTIAQLKKIIATDEKLLEEISV